MTIAKIIAGRSAADVVSCDVTTPVSEVVAILAGKRIGALPVMRAGSVAGIISERDIIYRLADQGASCLNMPVEAIMTSPAVTIESGTQIDDAMALMTKRRFRHFPVVENGALVAFISIGDLVKDKIDAVEQEAEAIRNYIQTA
ncbi:CBS domain-containing protein [Erythrobacter sp. F6033]|uniref:CBS domain-containing protein n=1 Tax=Erythrobacter sp. F6033 TaxID=2926401 RepID=UPI001FF37EB8|nr:CBS domain-containing protein [Erythrobacter sp. F6033]MCK0129731.1 CBS domain-containing protein [Erythrobacter sp. F6033]